MMFMMLIQRDLLFLSTTMMAQEIIYKNGILLRILGLKRDENMEWRRFHGEVQSLYRSPNIVRVIKSRRLRWQGI